MHNNAGQTVDTQRDNEIKKELHNTMKDWIYEVDVAGEKYGVVSCSAVACYSDAETAAKDTEFEQCYKDDLYDMLLKRGAISIIDEPDENGRIHRTWHLKALKTID